MGYLLAIAAALLTGYIWLASEKEREWDTFIAEHHCKLIEQTGSTTSTGLGIGSGKTGAVMLSTPGKKGYLCNDGVTYWK